MCVCDWVCVCKWEGGEGYMVGGGASQMITPMTQMTTISVVLHIGYLWTFDMLSKRILTIYNEIFGLLRMCVI